MGYEIVGQLSSKRNYSCSLRIEDKIYEAVILNNKFETQVFLNGRIEFESSYICENMFQKIFSCGFYKYYDKDGKEIFRLIKKGLLKLSTIIRTPDGCEIKLPYSNNFHIKSLGLNIKVNGDKFITTASDKKFLSLALLLSYNRWVRQQKWIETF